jgi:transcriptional regulator with XRE-family HTH domain
MKMKCSYCKVEMGKRRATDARPYVYKLSGLENEHLVGIEVFTCPRCGIETPVIPRVAQLHNVIADGIVRQSTMLGGDQIRFLRKHAGLPAQKFARLIGISPEHLSRIERGHTANLGKPTDRLVRALTLTATEGPAARAMLLSIADELAQGKKGEATQTYKLRRQGWRRQA